MDRLPLTGLGRRAAVNSTRGALGNRYAALSGAAGEQLRYSNQQAQKS
ncbi:MAG: hypothetical protein OXG51_10025 [Gammaproteobacteria bacterium]|nr:hypothetical protein [Gammaproteobacteria bacterium]